MTVPEAMRDPYLRRFDLRSCKIHAARGAMSFAIPRSYWELVGRANATTGQPYWADIWPASVALARQLLRGPDLDGCRALDLGCGIGVAGIAAGRAGAAVVFADLDEEALHFARFNAEHNGVAAFELRSYDWNRDLPNEDCNLLLLADVAYNVEHTDALLRQINAVLAVDGSVMLSDPYRASADALLEALDADLEVTTDATDVFFGGERVPMRIVTIAGWQP